MSIIVVNLQENRAVFRIFMALLRFSFDSPSYKGVAQYLTVLWHLKALPGMCLGETTLYSGKRFLSWGTWGERLLRLSLQARI